MPAVSPTAFDDLDYHDNDNIYIFRALMITIIVGLITIVVKVQWFVASAARAFRRRKFEKSAPRVRGRGALAAGRAAYESR